MPKDWNSVSESGSQSEDDRSHEQDKQAKNEQQQSKQEASQTSANQPTQNKSAEDVKQRPKFVSDQELIEKIKSKQLEERKKIKIVNCKSEELIEMIQKHKLINYLRQLKKQDKPSTYIACFKTEEDLIEFVQQKITNRYRFFLHPYFKTARDIERQKEYEQKRKQREQENKNKYANRNPDQRYERRGDDNRRQDDYRRGGRQDNRRQERRRGQEDSRREEGRRDQGRKDQGRRDYENRRENDNRKQHDKRQNDNRRGAEEGQKRRGRNRPEYEAEEKQQKRYEDRKEKRYQPKNPPVQTKPQEKPSNSSSGNNSKPEPKQKPSEKPEFNYTIEKNQIRILSNIYSRNRIVDDVIELKIPSKWDRIKIYVQKDGLNKIFELAELIWDRIGFGLKALPNENSKEQLIEVVLENKCHVVHPNSEFGLLTDNSKKYFEKVSSKNKYIIQKEFSIEEYVKGFKQAQKDICKKWKDWIIKGENQNIPNLLKLSWKLRREYYLNINIVVGKRGQVPFAVLEIEPESDKGKRPRPDTSVVNNYLN